MWEKLHNLCIYVESMAIQLITGNTVKNSINLRYERRKTFMSVQCVHMIHGIEQYSRKLERILPPHISRKLLQLIFMTISFHFTRNSWKKSSTKTLCSTNSQIRSPFFHNSRHLFQTFEANANKIKFSEPNHLHVRSHCRHRSAVHSFWKWKPRKFSVRYLQLKCVETCLNSIDRLNWNSFKSVHFDRAPSVAESEFESFKHLNRNVIDKQRHALARETEKETRSWD